MPTTAASAARHQDGPTAKAGHHAASATAGTATASYTKSIPVRANRFTLVSRRPTLTSGQLLSLLGRSQLIGITHDPGKAPAASPVSRARNLSR